MATGIGGGRLGRCAVVGSSGSLLDRSDGELIDSFDTVLRLNRAPTAGYERSVGSFTSVRLVNAPQSAAWAADLKRWSRQRVGGASAGTATSADADATPYLPKEVRPGELLVLSSSLKAWSAVAPRLVGVHALNRTFRKQCVAPFFTDDDRDAHTAEHHNRITPTFGFEAVVHALYACDSVEAFGFFIPTELLVDRSTSRPARAVAPPPQSAPQPQQPQRRQPFRYHYWEAQTVADKAADEPSKPWTYKSHNYPIESARLRHMAQQGCLLRQHLPAT